MSSAHVTRQHRQSPPPAPLSMVNFLLSLKADLENIASVAPGEHHRWTLDLKEAGGIEEKLGVVVSDEEEFDMAGGSGTAHFVVRSRAVRARRRETATRSLN